MSHRVVGAIEGQVEKKFKPSDVRAPTFFDRKRNIFIRKALVGRKYRNDDGTRFASWDNMTVSFGVCRSPWGPDMLQIMYRTTPGASRFTLEVHRKQQDDLGFRIVYRYENAEVDLTATETEQLFIITGPDFEMVLAGQDKERPGELVCREAESASLKLTALFNGAMKLIEAHVNFKCPAYRLKRVILKKMGQRRLLFTDDKGNQVKIDLVVFEEFKIRANKPVSIKDELLTVSVHTRDHHLIAASMNEALETLTQYFAREAFDQRAIEKLSKV